MLDNLRPPLLHHKPEVTAKDFAEIAGRVVWMRLNRYNNSNEIREENAKVNTPIL